MGVTEVLRVAQNGVVEQSRYYIGDQVKPKSKKRKKSKSRIKAANRKHAIVELARVLNNNFDPNAYLLTLTYDDSAPHALASRES